MPTKSLKAAERARDAAIEQVAESNAWWIRQVMPIVKDICLRRVLFTTDAVRHHADRLVGQAPEPRAMGAVMTAARRAGWCEPTNTTHQSIRVKCHARPLRVWRSLLLENGHE